MDVEAKPSTVKNVWSFPNIAATVAERLFSIDTRSLALFRVGLSLLLLADLITRAGFLSAFYTDQGVLPRGFIIDNVQDVWSFSFHLASGLVYFQAVLFVCAGLAAVLLLLGYRTRLMTFVSWALLVSLHVRNPEVLSAGDILLRVLLFWGLFLPLGLHWSVDRARATNEARIPQRVLSAATAAVLLQAAFVYLFTWLLKSGGPWRDGSAVRLALNWDQGTTAYGRLLLELPPPLLTLLTHGVVLFELLGPLLLFAPVFTPRVRLAVLPLFALLHLGFGLAMVLGTFPFVSLVSLTPFLPTAFWNLFGRAERGAVTTFYDGGCGFCASAARLLQTFLLVPAARLVPAQEDADAETLLTRENSWVVRDSTGDHAKASALKALLRASPLFWPFHYLLFGPVLRFADRLYGWVADHRPGASQFRWLRPRPLRWRLPLAAQLLVAVLLLNVLVWNLSSVLHFNAPLPQVMRALQLHQHWGMFAPYPRLDDGWYVVAGDLENGEKVDVFRAVVSGPGEALSWAKPEPVSATFPSAYWTKYFENLLRSEDKGRYGLFARYLCRNWNAAHAGGRRLVRFDVYFMLEHTERLDAPPEKIHLWWQIC